MNSKFIIEVGKAYREPFPVKSDTLKELYILQKKLINRIEKTILKDKETGRVFLELKGIEVITEIKYIKPKVIKWLNEKREQGLDEYNEGFSNTKELLDLVVDTWVYLKDLNRNYYPKESKKPVIETPPPSETKASKIASILKEKLSGAFYETGHIDKIIEALAEYAKGKTPECVENQKYTCMNIEISSKEFYTPFKGLNKAIGLTNKKIAEVLHYFIYANDGSQNAIQIESIEQNIKRKYPKAI